MQIHTKIYFVGMSVKSQPSFYHGGANFIKLTREADNLIGLVKPYNKEIKIELEVFKTFFIAQLSPYIKEKTMFY